MIFLYKNKLIVSVVIGLLSIYILVLLSNRNSSKLNVESESETQIESTTTSILQSSTLNSSDILKGLMVGVGLYLLLFFTDDDDTDVYSHIKMNEVPF